MGPVESENEILTIKELCDFLRVHPSTIYRMVKRGEIPSFRIGADWRFRREAIERWMAGESRSG